MILIILNLIACGAVVVRAVLDLNVLHAFAHPVQALRMSVLAAGAFGAGTAPLYGWPLTAPSVLFALAAAVVVLTHRSGRAAR